MTLALDWPLFNFDKNLIGDVLAQRVRTLADGDVHRPVERGLFEDGEGRPRADAEFGEIAQEGRVVVAHAGDAYRLAGFHVGEGQAAVGGDRPVLGGDGVAVRVHGRVAEPGGDLVLELFGDDVLEFLGLGVHFVPLKSQRLGQVEFDEPVMADDFQRNLAPGGGEHDPVVPLVVHQLGAAVGQLLQHAGDGGGGYAGPVP